MTYLNRLIVLIILLSAFWPTLLLGQHEPVAQRININQKSVPEIVLLSFKDQYPNAQTNGWYVTHLVYWVNDYSSNWYTEWYPDRIIIVQKFESPSYFEVEFNQQPNELSRAIYNRYGFWHETRTLVKGMPKAVYDAVKASKFANWKMSLVKEKIESPAWPKEIYRFGLNKGLKSIIMRIDGDGNIVQTKSFDE